MTDEKRQATKKRLLASVQPPGYELMGDAAREAFVEELAALPEDVDNGGLKPACERASEVIDALRRAAEREGVTAFDRELLSGWQQLQHAGAIAAFLDLCTISARVLAVARRYAEEEDLKSGGVKS